MAASSPPDRTPSVECRPDLSWSVVPPVGAIAMAMLLAVFVGLAGCGGTEVESAPGSGLDSTAWEASAVGVEATGCGLVASVGSGAIVAERELVVTTAHTVAGSNGIVVIDRDGNRHVADLVLVDPDQDIALLEVQGLDRPPLPLGPAEVGDDAGVAAWDPSGFRVEEVTVTDELSVTIEDIYIDHRVERQAIEFRGPVERGDSGAALVVDGAAVGIVYAKARNTDDVGYALGDTALADAVARLRAGDRSPIASGECVP